MTALLKLPATLMILLVRLYQVTLSPFIGGHCRFFPTCSHYAVEALQEHGAMRGSWLAARRVLRCHPFGGRGFDPVPQRTNQDNLVNQDGPHL